MSKHFMLIAALFGFSSVGWCIDYNACSQMLNKGWFKTYKYGGIDQPETKATKENGSSKGSSATSTEATTALSDPGYYSNVSTSETESTSTWGPCNGFALQRTREAKELYIAQNKDEVLRDISRGQGEHLNVLAQLSLCNKSEYGRFSAKIQARTADFVRIPKDAKYNDLIDSALREDAVLAKSCYVPI